MARLEPIDRKYYDYSQNDNHENYFDKHDHQCKWCDRNRESQEDWPAEEDCEYMEDLKNYQDVQENRKNVYWEDGDFSKNQINSHIRGKTSGEILCPHCNYYVNAAIDPGPKWYMSLLSTVLLPCCLCWLPRFTNALTTPRHRCPICSRVIFLDRTLSSGNQRLNYR